MNTPYSLKCYLKSAIDNAVAKCAKTEEFSRKSTLSRDTVIRLLIGALVEMLQRNDFEEKILIHGQRIYQILQRKVS